MDAKINLRIDDNIKLGLEELASDRNQRLSEYLRELLTDHVLEDINEEDCDFIDLPDAIDVFRSEKLQKNQYEQSYDFTYLLTWLFFKYMNPLETNGKEVIRHIKKKLERTINESSFSQELKLEFVKILHDLNRFLVEPDYDNKQFFFSTTNHPLSFNYYKLMDEIWALKY